MIRAAPRSFDLLRLLRTAALLVAGALAACAGGDDSGDARNLLFVSFDSTRRDMLGAYGHRPLHAPKEAVTPNLDGLAARGVLFEDAVATTSWTLPSHAALFTGLPDLVHAVEADGLSLGEEHRTLAQILRERGYRTAGFYSGPYLEPEFGFDRGFEIYAACYGAELQAASERARETARAIEALTPADGAERGALDLDRLAAWEDNVAAQRRLEVASQRDSSSAAVADAAIAELKLAAEDGRPFFLFTHFFDPHFDYVPPKAHATRFDPMYAGAITGEDFYRNPAVSTFDVTSPSGRTRQVSERDLEHLLALYEGDLAWADAQLGRVLMTLEELDLAEETLVVFVADHGDELFEHGGIGHRRTLFEEVVRVPMVFGLPGVLPAGARVSQVVSTADVLPTVLELLAVPAPPTPGSSSLVPLMKGKATTRTPAGVMSRIVRTRPARYRVEGAAGEVMVPVDLLIVTEAYRSGTLKVTRERSWIRSPENASEEERAAVRAEGTRMFAEEELSWIDLELSPEEADDERSQDFSEPRALAVLREFRTLYRELLQRRATRTQGDGGDPDEALLGALRGLGYAGDTELFAPVASATFLLPPPGEALLADEE